MSNRRQSTFEVAQMGKVWIASISLFGISAIGATEADAIRGVLEALATHSSIESGNHTSDMEA